MHEQTSTIVWLFDVICKIVFINSWVVTYSLINYPTTYYAYQQKKFWAVHSFYMYAQNDSFILDKICSMD